MILVFGAFLAANPYALLDHSAFQDGLTQQTETAGDEGGKLGLANTNGWLYYLGTYTWGFGWLPSLAALGGGDRDGAQTARLRADPAARAARPVPLPRPPVALLLALDAAGLPDAGADRGVGGGDAGRAACSRRGRAAGRGRAGAPAGPRLHDPQRRRAGPRRHPRAGPRVDGQEHPGRLEDRRRADRARPVGRRPRLLQSRHRQRQPLEQMGDVALAGRQPRQAAESQPRRQARGLRAHHAARPGRRLPARRLLLGRDRLDPDRPRLRRPQSGPAGDQVLRRAQGARRRRLPRQTGIRRRAVLLRLVFNYRPLSFSRPGPEIIIYHLRNCTES